MDAGAALCLYPRRNDCRKSGVSGKDPLYGPLPAEGGRIGFIGIPAEGRDGSRGNTGN